MDHSSIISLRKKIRMVVFICEYLSGLCQIELNTHGCSVIGG